MHSCGDVPEWVSRRLPPRMLASFYDNVALKAGKSTDPFPMGIGVMK